MSRTTKRVRFTGVPSPSPSTSSASLDSSPGPSTPPQLQPMHLPHPNIVRPPEYPPWQQPMPAMVPMPVTLLVPSPPYYATHVAPEPESDILIDPLLAAPMDPAHPPPLWWDVGEHPNAIKLGSIGEPHARQLSHDDLASPAVRSGRGSPQKLRKMTLIFPGLPLVINIEPDDRPVWTSTPLHYLTVGDVLYGLYRSLRLSVERGEFDRQSASLKESMRRAFERRRERDSVANWEKNTHHGVRHIDFLGEMRRLVGLRAAVGEEIPYGKRRGEVFVVKLASAH